MLKHDARYLSHWHICNVPRYSQLEIVLLLMNMGEGKSKEKNLHQQSRVSFLLQAATYLTNPNLPLSQHEASNSVSLSSDSIVDVAFLTQKEHGPILSVDSGSVFKEEQDYLAGEESAGSGSGKARERSNLSNLPRQLITSLLTISQKAQVRLPSSAKHSICKRCHSVLILGSTATSQIENKSLGRKKAWAAVLVKTCNHCGTVKRFPVGAKRQRSKRERRQRAMHD